MTWIAVLCAGVALGWAIEFLVDLWFWGRRNRRLEAQLSTCRSDFQASEIKLREARDLVSQYRIKEDEYQKCQYDLTDLANKHNHLEVEAETMSMELESSHDLIGQFDTQISELKTELDQSQMTLEEVDRWIESGTRSRVWDTVSWKSGINRSKEKSVAYVRSMATNATSKLSQAAGKFNGSVSTAKAKINRTIDQSWLVRFFNRSYCNVWGLIGSIFRKSEMPPSCSYNSK